MKPELPNDVVYLIDRLNKCGHEAYAVGGCVRDSLMGRTPNDWDITTSAKPMEVKEIFPHTFDTGIAHGTVTVVKNSVNYEITTYRIDGEYTDNRHPKSVCFTGNLQEDLRRRDFTMNAIAYHPDLGFQDPFNGLADIEKQIIRGVGDSSARFLEDALRMLRCIRFSAQLGFVIETKTYEAIVSNKALIKNISAERIREELEKLLLSPYTEKLPLLWDSGLLGEISNTLACSLETNGDKVVKQLMLSPLDKIIRFTLLLQFVKPVEGVKFLKSLKPDGQTLREVTVLLNNLDVFPPISSNKIKAMAASLGIERFLQLIKVQDISARNTNALKTLEIINEAIKNNECILLKDLALKGNDLHKIGMDEGRGVGEALQKALAHVHEFPNDNNKESLLLFLKSQTE